MENNDIREWLYSENNEALDYYYNEYDYVFENNEMENINTNIDQCDNLFNKLMEYSYENEFNYNISGDDETNEDFSYNLIEEDLRDSFYLFCYLNSRK